MTTARDQLAAKVRHIALQYATTGVLGDHNIDVLRHAIADVDKEEGRIDYAEAFKRATEFSIPTSEQGTFVRAYYFNRERGCAIYMGAKKQPQNPKTMHDAYRVACELAGVKP